MTNQEIIAEIRNMKKFNYTLAPDEVFEKSIKALTIINTLENMIQYYDRPNQPPRTITTDDLKEILEKSWKNSDVTKGE